MANIYDQVSQNKLRSNLLMVLFVSFITLSVYLISLTLELDYSFTIFAFIFSLASSLISYFFGSQIVLSLNGAKPAERQDYFNFYTVTENLSLANNTPMPKIYVINSSAPNAFATGTDPQNASICATTGLLEKLDRTELEGVIAHELSHIKNFDTRIMTLVSVLIGSLSILINQSQSLFYRKNRDRNRSSVLQIFGLVLIIFAPIIGKIIQLAISRQREYLADSGAVKLTRQPQGLISALQKISADSNPLNSASTATASLYIINPFKGQNFSHLFSTHPPVEKRIQALKNLL